MSKAEYAHVHRRVARALAPELCEAEAAEACKEDWDRDCGGAETITFEAYADGLYELADIWTTRVDELEYVIFLNKLFRRVTMRSGNAGYAATTAETSRQFRPVGDIVTISRLDDVDAPDDANGQANHDVHPIAPSPAGRRSIAWAATCPISRVSRHSRASGVTSDAWGHGVLARLTRERGRAPCQSSVNERHASPLSSRRSTRTFTGVSVLCQSSPATRRSPLSRFSRASGVTPDADEPQHAKSAVWARLTRGRSSQGSPSPTGHRPSGAAVQDAASFVKPTPTPHAAEPATEVAVLCYSPGKELNRMGRTKSLTDIAHAADAGEVHDEIVDAISEAAIKRQLGVHIRQPAATAPPVPPAAGPKTASPATAPRSAQHASHRSPLAARLSTLASFASRLSPLASRPPRLSPAGPASRLARVSELLGTEASYGGRRPPPKAPTESKTTPSAQQAARRASPAQPLTQQATLAQGSEASYQETAWDKLSALASPASRLPALASSETRLKSTTLTILASRPPHHHGNFSILHHGRAFDGGHFVPRGLFG